MSEKVSYESIKLSKAPIKRAIKYAIDDNPVSKEAVEYCTKLAVDSVIHLAEEAYKYATAAKRKTLTLEDIKLTTDE